MSIYDKDLAEKRSIDDILAHRALAIKTFGDALQLLNDAQRHIYQYAPYALSLTDNDTRGFSRISSDSEKARVMASFTKFADKGIWRYLGSATGLERLMDHTALKDWEKHIETETPECNIETLEATFNYLNENKTLIFNRGLVKAFSSLEGRYKTNDSFKISRRVIVSNAVGHRSPGSDYLDDVERVLFVLDKRKPPEYQHSVRSLLINVDPPDVLETDYMSLRVCKNENVHVSFKRLDTIEKANKIIAAYFGSTLQSDSKRKGHPGE